jgi:hypothetical protein
VRQGRLRGLAAAAVLGSALLLCSSAIAAPRAEQAGAIVNYLPTGKLRVAKKVVVPFVCSVSCSVVSTLVLKGPAVRGSDIRQVSLGPNSPVGHRIKPRPKALRLMKRVPRKYRLISTITATDIGTGAKETVMHTFRFRRS